MLKILSSAPAPYEYALMSKLVYSDRLDPNFVETDLVEAAKHMARLKLLTAKGWRVAKFIASDNDYRGAIWANDTTKQVVLAHRGSQNITSWVTDIESIVKKQSGAFTNTALALLSDPTILGLRTQDYRFSSTGHSLGGFLAQLCVYWAQRPETKETYYPDMNAVVFDSPGVAGFLDEIHYNPESSQKTVEFDKLKIHNFCAMPTVVSTYGKQTGTTWQLTDSEGESLANDVKHPFLMMHQLDHMIRGFNTETGLPFSYRQMEDWPEAEYASFSSFSDFISYAAGKSARTLAFLPLDLLNKAYKTLRGRSKKDKTWYEQIIQENEGEVAEFLKAQKEDGYLPLLDSIEAKLIAAIDSHYVCRERSDKELDLWHFDAAVQSILEEIVTARKLGLLEAWGDSFDAVQKEALVQLFNEVTLKTYGSRQVVSLSESYQGNIFNFKHALLGALSQCSNAPSFSEFAGNLIRERGEMLAQLGVTVVDLDAAIAELGKKKAGRTINWRSAVNRKPDGIAYRPLGKEDYEEKRYDDLDALEKKLKPGDTGNMDCSVNEAPGGVAVTNPPSGMTQAQRKDYQFLLNCNSTLMGGGSGLKKERELVTDLVTDDDDEQGQYSPRGGPGAKK